MTDWAERRRVAIEAFEFGREVNHPTRARMLGRVAPSHCPYCHGPPGPDCPDRGRSTRQQKRRERLR